MPMRVTCPHCHAVHRLAEQLVDKEVSCARCKKKFSVSGPAPALGRLVGPGTPARAPSPAAAGSDINSSSPSGASSADLIPKRGLGGLCLVGCLLIACVFVIILGIASIGGWWLIGRQESQAGFRDSEPILPAGEHP